MRSKYRLDILQALDVLNLGEPSSKCTIKNSARYDLEFKDRML